MGTKLVKNWTTNKFRTEILEKYPALTDSIEFRRFFKYLAFGTFFEKGDEWSSDGNSIKSELVIPSEQMYTMITKDPEYHPSKMNFKLWLENFKALVLPGLEWSDYSKDGSARTVVNNGFDDETEAMIKREIGVVFDRSFPSGTYVFFTSGENYNMHTRTKHIEKIKVDHETELAKFTLSSSQETIIKYMEKLDGGKNHLRKLNENRLAVESMISELPDHKRMIQSRIMRSIEEQPLPLYRPSEKGRTVRISNCNDSIVAMPSAIRKAACKGWTEFDLRSSQFAIISAELNAPIAKAFIKGGGILWESLYLHTHGIVGSPPPEIKRVYKELFYGIAFGTAEKTIPYHAIHNAKKENKNKPIIALDIKLERHGMKNLLEHTIVKELLSLRALWYKKITEDGGATDVYGKFHAITNDRKAHAIGASIIQAKELEIIVPVFEVAKKRPLEMKITCWQHDGGTVSFGDKEHKHICMREMNEAVQKRATELGVTTSLEFTDL